MKIRKRHFEILIYLILFNLYRIYKKIIPKKNIKKRIAIQTPDMEGNLYAVSEELKKKTDIHFYWIAYENKKFLEKMKNKGEECYYDLDISKIPLFYNTNIFIGTPGMGNIPTKYFKPGKWVDLWHGLPFKGFNCKQFVDDMNRFDKICVASDWFKKIYSSWGIKKNKMEVTGYARTDKLVKQKINNKKIRLELKLPLNKKIIFYTPTWEQDSLEIKELFPWAKMEKTLEKMDKFCENNNALCLIRPHKLWKNKFAENKLREIFFEKNKFNNIKYIPFDKFNLIEDLLLVTDILITDWSSTSSDFILLDRPMVFLDFPAPFKHGFTLSPEDRVGTIISKEKDFFKILKKKLSQKKIVEKNKGTVLEKLYGKNLKYADGNASKRCTKVICDLI